MDDAAVADAIRRLADPWRPTRHEAAAELLAGGPAVIEALRPILTAAEPDHDLAHLCIWILEQLDTPAAHALLADYWERFG